MNIVIIGAGKVGEKLCRDLASEGHDVILIELDAKILHYVQQYADITGVIGNGADHDVLLEAGADRADVTIAATDSDEINIITSMIAKRLGAKHTIARVRQPEYANHQTFMRSGMGIDIMINPEREAAREVIDLIRYPSALSIERFYRNVRLVEIVIGKDSVLCGKNLIDFQKRTGGTVLVCVVVRDGQPTIPKGPFVLEADDHIFVTGDSRDLIEVYKLANAYQKNARSVMIIGGGRLTHYLLQMQRDFSVDVKVIERDGEKAIRLADRFSHATIIEADGTDQETLDEERVGAFDCVVALTGIDEENILIGMYAQSRGVGRTIVKVNRTQILKILPESLVQSIVTPKHIVADEIIRYVRSLAVQADSRVEALHRIVDGRVEALQFFVEKASGATGIRLMDLPIKKEVLIANIIRGDQSIFPSGRDTIEPGDRVIVVTTLKEFDVLDDILEEAGS